MRFLSTLAVFVTSLITFALAADNPFIAPTGGYHFKAGVAGTIKWTATTQGTITLVLRSGDPDHLEEGMVIVSKADNSGSYEWTPPTSITRGSDYAFQIISDDNPAIVNYIGPVVIDSDNIKPSSTSKVTYGLATGTTLKTSASASGTGSASASATTTDVVSAADVSTTSSANASKTASSSATATAANASGTEAAPSSVPTTGGAAKGGVAGGVVAVVVVGVAMVL